jgi:hypothetical protein
VQLRDGKTSRHNAHALQEIALKAQTSVALQNIPLSHSLTTLRSGKNKSCAFIDTARTARNMKKQFEGGPDTQMTRKFHKRKK